MKGNKVSNRKLISSWVTGQRKHKHGNLILISHLGNISGVQEDQQNTPGYLQNALAIGYSVCCEVVAQHGAMLLPTKAGYCRLPYAMLSNPQVWFLAADPVTLNSLCDMGAHVVPVGAAVTLTTVQYLWCLPGTALPPRAIAVYPELAEPGWLESGEPAGVCSNEISRYL